MSAPYSLAQLTCFGATVYAQCGWCDHFSVVEHARLVEIGMDVAVADAQARMRCRVCKRKQCRLTTDRPAKGVRECAKCGAALWKPKPMDVPRNARLCSRCGRPVIRD